MTAARRVAPMKINWGDYGPCPREGCGATAGKPCVHQKHGTAMRNPHPDRPTVLIGSLDDNDDVVVVAAAQAPAEAPDEPATDSGLRVINIGGDHFLYDGETFAPIAYHVVP